MKIKTFVIALLTLLFIFPALAGAAAVGKLTSVEGKVDITSPGKEARPAGEGDALAVGDIIRSKSKSKCEVTFGDGNILRLAENTRLKITQYMFEKDKRDEVLNLFRGKIQNIVQKVAGAASPEKAGRYEIHTPTAVAGVRGTNFFAYHQSGISGAIFKEGTGYGYSVNRPQEIRTITPGQAMVVTNPNQPPTVRPATTQELEQHQKETAPAEKKAKEEGGKKDGDDKKTETAAAKTDDGNGKKDDAEKKPEEAKKAEAEKAPESAPKADEAKQAGDNGKTETAAAAQGGGNGSSGTTSTGTGSGTQAVEGGNTGGIGSFQQSTQQASVGQSLSPETLANLSQTIANIATTSPNTAATTVINTDTTSTQNQRLIVDPVKPPQTCAERGLPDGCDASALPIATPPPPDMKAVILSPSTAFTHRIDNGLFTGVIDAATGGIITAVGGTTDNSTPVDPGAGYLGQGTFTNETSFAGYFLGLPAGTGTARALTRSIYVTSTGEAGFLSGPVVGIFIGGNAFGGAGKARQETALGTTVITPADLEGAMNTAGWTLGQPNFGNITAGNASAPFSIAAGNAEGEVRGISLNDGTKIGVWGVITHDGTYQNPGGSSKIGGNFGDSGTTASGAYHMRGNVKGEDTTAIDGMVTLAGDLAYLDRYYEGTAKFDYYGYNAGGTGGFRSIMAGDVILKPLAWSATIDSGLYTVDDAGIHQAGNVSGGLAGSLVSPWSGRTDFTHMGKYAPANGRGPYVWLAPIYSYDSKVGGGVNQTYDGGAFFGLIGGVWQGDGGLDARVYATYVSPDGKAGILKGEVRGAYFSDVSMYQDTGDGTVDKPGTGWTAVELGTGLVGDVTALKASSPNNEMTDTAGTLFTLGGSFSGASGPTGSILRPTASLATIYQSRTYGPADNKWGIWQSILGGTYSGTTSGTWYLGTDYHDPAYTVVTGTETVGSQWSTQIFNGQSVNKLLGESRGFGADIVSSSPFTWVSAGETIGSFNPTTASWQAVQTMVGIETNTFLTLAQTDAGRATLQQLNIPAVEVGKAILRQSVGTVNNLSGVTMTDVTFFANATGGAPRIWATNAVSGNYSLAAPPVAGGTAVPLSGNGLNASFNVKTWDTTNGKWLSTVTNGNGTYNNTNRPLDSLTGKMVGFRGAAAGTINTSNSTFSGTAAGTAK